ncbi:hypothetical protein C5748_26815 [Phyllobacterium phragmitis]|uniref:DUF680 domain-containing protein n=1 Tax=Phyllobacterium phragmitis TaxID=2670329 RepID=A0A2S9IIW7_9HYPH|nr:hypothetical protein [Phyllobacterium phragmitis]PRD40459.1 hypothetical protein C5748_26815 [Phyllobacterium phragmitis]
MRKFLILTSALSVLAAGNASAQDFRVSNPNAAPGDLGPVAVYTGETVSISPGRIGYNAADDFGRSSHNAAPKNRPAERKVADREIVTSSTGTRKVYTGYNASDDFNVSDD